MLEKDQASGGGSGSLKDLPLFAAACEEPEKKASLLHETVQDINPDELTPRSALELIYRLKEIERQDRE